ncbi:hypothetical protein [Jannaschia seohaensis]|uniref:Uncharacterized protein n=1 Tax=Jannaschia seohaensis TaxID=475081 RepID=A0A2Y9A1L8_9RHOB|nr:hypothetical protein [Jannaschia seohaensis]PWJ22052.1 hypothetical protein BCF38_101461 [Jannaschia seohaensis]SSA38330.1 hypothetical protein SAMN05421539_101461 [Jannaschia seohaensis]
MSLEILLGGLVGLSFIAVLIYLLTQQEAARGSARSASDQIKSRSEDDKAEDDTGP